MRHFYLQQDEGHRDQKRGDRNIASCFQKDIRQPATKGAILCKRCPDYALAKLNGTPLCLSCLMKSIEKNVQPSGKIEMKIEPLSILSGG
jgi:hypothetical protein